MTSILLVLALIPQAQAVPDACDAFGSPTASGSIDLSDVTFQGGVSANAAGYSLASGDFNGDGETDLAVGAPGDRNNGVRAGAVYVFYGPMPLAGDLEPANADTVFVGPGPNYRAGWSIDNAGDVDSDGRDDLIIGALPDSRTANPQGIAWMVYGGAALPALVDLGFGADITFTGLVAEDEFGAEVAGVGDVTGDGIPDVAIGAVEDASVFNDGGAVYIYAGPTTGIYTGAEADAVVAAPSEFARIGGALARVGDLDGDGIDDLVMGAQTDRSVASRAGGAYVFYGGAGITGTLDPTGADSVLQGRLYDRLGSSIAAAGDVDGDGLADFWVGAAHWGGSRRGAAYLMSGADTGAGTVPMESTYASRILGYDAADLFGTSVAGGADVDGDGQLDVIIGGRQADGAQGVFTGAAWVLTGPFETQMTAGVGGAHWGTHRNANAGHQVGMVSDLNGDGFDEFLVGAWRQTYKGIRRTGTASLYYGGEDVADLVNWYVDADGDGYGDDGTAVTACESPVGTVALAGDCDDARNDVFPYAPELDCGSAIDFNCDGSVGNVDVDGDGVDACLGDCDDGAFSVNPSGTEVCGDGVDNDCDGGVDDANSSDAMAWYPDGDADGFGDDLLGVVACEQPAIFLSDVVNIGGDCDDTAIAVSPAGVEVCDGVDNDCSGTADGPDALDAQPYYTDADADGYGDLTSLAFACTVPAGGVANADDCDDTDGSINPDADEICDRLDNDCDGRFYLGGALEAEEITSLSITTEGAGDDFGRHLAFVPDLNGDGLAELVIGAPGSNLEGTDAGAVYLRYGSSIGGVVDYGETLADGSPTWDQRIVNDRAGGFFGSAIAGGDFNGDGMADLAVSAPKGSRPNNDQGVVFVFYGPLMAVTSTTEADVVINGSAGGAQTGISLAAADLDADGTTDLVIGSDRDSTSSERSGAAYVLYGGTLATGRVDAVADAVLYGLADDELGRTVALGDFNGDGTIDVVAAGPESGALDLGVLAVAWGTGTRFAGPLTADVQLFGVAANEGLGRSMANAGDADGDCIDDLVVGSRRERAFLVSGGSWTAGSVQAAATTVVEGTPGQAFSREVAGAGDLDGDGFDDLVFTAHRDDAAADDGGAVAVLYGSDELPATLSINELESFGRLPDAGTFPTYSASNLGVSEGAFLYGNSEDQQLGWGVAAGGDLNGDGYGDLAIASLNPQGSKGQVLGVYAGPYGTDFDEAGDPALAASQESYVVDADLDGFGDENAASFETCQMHAPISFEDPTSPSLAVTGPAFASDCDDTESTIYPGAIEIPGDGIDQDCDGLDVAGVCVDSDVWEGADAIAGATVLTDGSYTGLEVCDDDADYFAVALVTGDTLDLAATFASGDGTFSLDIVDGSDTVLAAGSVGATAATATFEATADGAVYVRAVLSADAGPTGFDYDLDVTITAAVSDPALTDVVLCGGAVTEDCLDPGVMSVWLRADQLDPAVSAVTLWEDMSGAGNDAVQADGGRTPIRVDSGINGHFAVQFDGVTDRLDLTSNVFGGGTYPKTVYLVVDSDDDQGHVIGTGSSEAGFLTSHGGGLVLQGDLPSVKANIASSGLFMTSGEAMGDQPRLISFVMASGGSELYVDGYIRATSRITLNPQTAYTRSTIGASDGVADNQSRDPWAGQIAEILVVDGAQTHAERRVVEEGLAAYYGLEIWQETDCNGVPEGPALFDHCGECDGDGSTCAFIDTLSPELWLEADTLANTHRSYLSSWPSGDASARTADAAGPTNQPEMRRDHIGEHAAVWFDGDTDRLDLSENLFSDAHNNKTVFIVMQPETPDAHVLGTASSTASVYGWGNGIALLDYAPIARANSSSSGAYIQAVDSVAVNTPMVVSAVIQDGNTQIYTDGYFQGSSAASFNAFPYTRSTLGCADGAGINATISCFKGGIAEVIVFGSVLSDTDRRAVEAYLATRYGLDHAAPNMVGGLRLDMTGEYFSITPNGTSVGTWQDLSGQVNHANQPFGGQQPTVQTVSGRKVVRFDGIDDRMDLDYNQFADVEYPMSGFVVLRTSDASGHVLGFGSSSAGFITTYGSGLYLDGGSAWYKANSNGSGLRFSGGPIADGQFHLMSWTAADASSSIYQDGTLISTSAAAITAYAYSRSTLGASDGSAAGAERDPWAGDLAEIRIYGLLLNTEQREVIEDELAAPYGIVLTR